MYDHNFPKLANHQTRHQATHKVGCQPGDCIWSLNLPQGFVWVGSTVGLHMGFRLCPYFQTHAIHVQVTVSLVTAYGHFNLPQEILWVTASCLTRFSIIRLLLLSQLI